jgi:hypothetical protein
MHFMNRAGMMRSVSISAPGTHTPRPVMEVIFARAMVKEIKMKDGRWKNRIN